MPTCRLLVDFAVTLWKLGVSASTLEKLEACQRLTERALTGHLRTMALEGSVAEVKFPAIETHGNQRCTIALETSYKLTNQNPVKQPSQTTQRQRTTEMS